MSSCPAPDGETLSDGPTDAQLIDRLESALLAAKAADTTQDADEWYYLADTYSEQLADRLAALRAELADARADNVTRVELIDHRGGATAVGRAFVAYGVAASISIQDEGRTLKVFVTDRATRAASGKDASHE